MLRFSGAVFFFFFFFTFNQNTWLFYGDPLILQSDQES